MPRRRVIPILLLLLSFLAIKGCSLIPGLGLRPFKVGMNDWPGYQVAFYGQRTGIFAKHGLEVEFVRFNDQQDNIRATMREFQDASFVSLAEVMQVDSGAQEPVFILVVNISNGADGIVATSGIERVPQLRGKTVSAKLGTLSHLILLEALQASGVKPADIQIADVANERGALLLQGGQVDAAVLWEPQLTEIARKIQGNVIYTTANVNSLVIDGLATREELVRTKRRELISFIQAWLEIMEAVTSNPEAVFKVVAEELGTSPAEFAAEFSGLLPGTQAMNYDMFVKGHLAKIATQTRDLLLSDPRHARIVRREVRLEPGPLQEATGNWQ